jgi:hypothetical protein
MCPPAGLTRWLFQGKKAFKVKMPDMQHRISVNNKNRIIWIKHDNSEDNAGDKTGD